MDPLKIDWEAIWQKSIQKGLKKEKNWDAIAKDYGKWLENDDYPDVLLKEMRISFIQNGLRDIILEKIKENMKDLRKLLR